MYTNKFVKKQYFLDYDYIQKHLLSSKFDIPKVDNLLITLFQNSAKEGTQVTFDNNTKIKLSVLFYTIINKIPKIKILSDGKKSKRQLESKSLLVQQFSTKNKSDINKILETLFLRVNLNSLLDKASFYNDSLSNTTSVTVKYPLSLLNEAVELDQEYNLSVKDLYFSITLKFNKVVTKNDTLNLIYFG